jgi:hypothetical protein
MSGRADSLLAGMHELESELPAEFELERYEIEFAIERLRNRYEQAGRARADKG